MYIYLSRYGTPCNGKTTLCHFKYIRFWDVAVLRTFYFSCLMLLFFLWKSSSIALISLLTSIFLICFLSFLWRQQKMNNTMMNPITELTDTDIITITICLTSYSRSSLVRILAASNSLSLWSLLVTLESSFWAVFSSFWPKLARVLLDSSRRSS